MRQFLKRLMVSFRYNRVHTRRKKLHDFHRGLVFGINFLKANSSSPAKFAAAVKELDFYSDQAETFNLRDNFDLGMNASLTHYSGESYG